MSTPSSCGGEEARVLSLRIEELTGRIVRNKFAIFGAVDTIYYNQEAEFGTTDPTAFSLTADEMVPVVSSTASGSAIATLRIARGPHGAIDISGNFQGLSSNVETVQVHFGRAGDVEGDALFELEFEDNEASGQFWGTWPVSETELATARAAEINIIVKTTDHPDGEIRGQIIVSEP